MAHTTNKSGCNFNLGMSNSDFEFIVTSVAKNIERIESVSVRGSQVKATVKSITGLTYWDFSLNFNDNGFLTGEYNIDSDNTQSDVPHCFAEQIKQAVKSFPNIEVSEDKLIHDVKESDYHKLLMKYIAGTKELDRKSGTIETYKKKYIKTAIAIPIIIVILFLAFAGILQVSEKNKPKIAVNFDSSDVANVMLVDVVNMFSDTGFTNIQLKPAKELSSDKQFDEGKVKSITIDGKKNFKKGNEFKSNAKIVITYYALKEIQFPFSSEEVVGKSKDEVLTLLNDAGFLNIQTFALPYQWTFPNDAVINVQFDDSKNVEKGVLVRPDVLVIIYFKF